MPKESPTLKEIQKWMRWIVIDPRGVKGALGDPKALRLAERNRKYRKKLYTEPKPSCLPWVLPAETSERLSVYAEGYFFRIKEVLSETFPKVNRRLGKKFTELVIEYLKAYPSTSFTLSDSGENLPRFMLAKYPPSLCELARWEWALHETYFAARIFPTVPKNVNEKSRLRFHRAGQFVKKGSGTWFIYRDAKVVRFEPVPNFVTPAAGLRFQTVSRFCRRVIGSQQAAEVSTFFSRWSKLGLLEFTQR